MSNLDIFKQTIYDYYKDNRRDFIWRRDPTPYQVVVSEIMLQQTQTERVIGKYTQFITELPSFQALAQATTRQVLVLWQGLGYNRRGLALHDLAKQVVEQYGGILPSDPELLQKFKGIGPATAGSISAFAFNKPTIFIETNIRSVFIHAFFKDKEKVHDKELLPLIEATLDKDNAREWYYALTDYGVMLKKTYKNPARKSAHHQVQSRFEGSDRQIRGLILKLLAEYFSLTQEEIVSYIPRDANKVVKILDKLVQEETIKERDNSYYL